ncbi:hypothetical protein BC833DRAFT_573362 [Globomyces pollinis-pini]|nr:hypothetical protein BC833DRAFT_573362 [Globomyces pollinis-pini]KAJ3000990.1 ER membrane complex subunit 2 [Globomyces sp. JEL0801]
MVKDFNLTDARLILAHYRNETLPGLIAAKPCESAYDPNEVLELGAKIVKSYKNSITAVELYSIFDQLLVASVHTGDIPRAKLYLTSLENAFPKSSARLIKLQGLILEANGKFDEAIQLYETVLRSDLEFMDISKRRIMCFIAKNDHKLAIDTLVFYLDIYMQDTDAWVTLANLYTLKGFYHQAAYCWEELLILRPRQHLYMLKYADLMAGIEKLDVALKFYCGVIELVKDSVHAWYGIRTITDCLLEDKSKATSTQQDTWKSLNTLANKQILLLYNTAPPVIKSTVTSWLDLHL